MLSDNESRERFIQELGSTFFVEAGAGAGKTSALVTRIVELVKSGVPVDRMAAITFTEKAASELEDRIRQKLEQLAASPDQGPEVCARCRESVQLLDGAAIETLHAFAQRLLMWYPLEAGLPPGFEVSDEFQGKIAFLEWRREAFDRMIQDEEVEESLTAFLDLGGSIQNLRDLSVKLKDNWDRIGEAPLIDPPEWRPSLERVIDRTQALVAMQSSCTSETDKMLAQIRDLRPHLDEYPGEESLPPVLIEWLGGCPKLKTNVGAAGNWQISVTEPKDCCKELNDAVANCAGAIRLSLAAPVTNRLAREVLSYVHERKKAGLLEFQDILVHARDLLLSCPRVRQSLFDRFHTILIDEYQDTDPLQVDIVSLIASGASESSPSWEGRSIADGRLAFVGDPKQSIYRFRRADIGVYRKTQDTIGGQTLTFNSNFRSTRPIIDFVNTVFPNLIQMNGAGCDYKPLTFARNVPDEAGSIYLFKDDSPTGLAPQRHRTEADAIARAVVVALAEKWPVHDDTGARPPKKGDVAVLIPSRTILPHLEYAFDQYALPYRVESNSLLFGTREANELVSLLRAIDDPTNQVAVVGALRSAAFGLDDRDLLEHVAEGGGWNYLRCERRGNEAVSAALDVLADYHTKRLDHSPAMLLDMIIRDRQMMEVALAARRPRDRWRRYRLLVNQARRAGEASGSTLRQFIQWCKQSEDERAWVQETVAAESDDDAVRILTLHASKGLEFPIVALCGLGVEPRQRETCFWGPDGRIVLNLASGKFRTPGAVEACQHEELQLQAERARLLYVGCTRARDHLIVSAAYRPSKNGPAKNPSCAEQLAMHVPAEMWKEPCRGSSFLGQSHMEPPEPFQPDTAEMRDRWVDERNKALASQAELKTMAATTIAHKLGTGPDDPALIAYHVSFEDSLPSRRGRAGTNIGRAVHATLQSIDLDEEEDGAVASAAQAHAAAEGLTDPKLVSQVARHVRSALAAAPVREAVQAKRWWREVFVAAEVSGTLLEGYIDLMWECDDGSIRLLDYKTDRVNNREDADWAVKRRYRLQAATYALALEKALGKRPASAQFVFSAAEPAIVVEVEDLDEAMKQVSRHVAAVLGD